MSLFDFENRHGLFAGVHRSYKISLVTLGSDVSETTFVCFATDTEHLADTRRRFTLSVADMRAMNPNTRTCPVFRSRVGADPAKKIYHHVPVLIDDTRGENGNPWGIKFTTMFHMANDSGLFRTAAQLFAEGAQPRGANWVRPHGETWVPLYEAKMIHQYDHRWATYEDDGKTSRNATQRDKADPHYQIQPRYWVVEEAVAQRLRDKGWTREWLIGWRDICRSTDQRTVISGVFPKAACGDKFLLMILNISPRYIAALLGNLNALCLDFIARQKLGGTSLKYFTMKQMTILPPTHFTEVDLDFIFSPAPSSSYTPRTT